MVINFNLEVFIHMKYKISMIAMALAFESGYPGPVEQLRRVKSEFLAGLNHEMRTPLSGVLGMVDLLLETPLDEQQKDYATAARSCAAELLESLNAALEFAAISAGSFALDEQEFNLAETLNGAARRHDVRCWQVLGVGPRQEDIVVVTLPDPHRQVSQPSGPLERQDAI